ncbi:MAG: M1 family metallopeptidase [Clostridia bacterium]|jgi:hypothetical protein|nr:M1 family metallopeptidase [Clostridiales bacterium]
MKKVVALIMLAVVLVMLCSCLREYSSPVSGFPAEAIKVNQYSINCYYDEVEKLLKGYQHLTYYNNSETIFEDIYMHLYPNAFENEDTAPFEPFERGSAYPDGFNTGFLNIDSVQVGGQPGDWEYKSGDRQVLRIRLPQPLYPGESVEVDIYFTVKFPHCHGRLGYGNKTVKAANWYPIAAVFDSNGWNLDPYHAIGDPFYSDVADYRVSLVLPKNYTVATTGEVLKKRRYDGKNSEWTIRADNVRDFTWVASEEFLVSSKKSDGITIKSYYFDKETGKKTLEFATDAISVFNRCFGKYPYKTYSVVAADFFVGGMEYPNLVLISKELYNIERLFTLEYITVHETAHQWWYGIVGSNQYTEAWLDEGLTEYSTILYFEKKYGPDTAKGLFENLIKKRYEDYVAAAGEEPDVNIQGTLLEYQDSEQYHTLVYCGGALIFQNLRDIMGDEDFFKALQLYYRNYAFQNATAEDFIRIVENIGDTGLRDRIREWLVLGV